MNTEVAWTYPYNKQIPVMITSLVPLVYIHRVSPWISILLVAYSCAVCMFEGVQSVNGHWYCLGLILKSTFVLQSVHWCSWLYNCAVLFPVMFRSVHNVGSIESRMAQELWIIMARPRLLFVWHSLGNMGQLWVDRVLLLSGGIETLLLHFVLKMTNAV